MRKTQTMLRVTAAVALIAVAIAVLASGEETVLVDQTGRTMHIAQPVERLASVYGAGTYIVYALGASDRLVMGWYIGVKGIAHASEAMYQLEPQLKEILAFGDPSIEEMAARGVQLVFVDGSRHGGFAEQMAELGIPVVQFLVETPDALQDAVQLAARALGPSAVDRAERFADDYARILDTVTSDVVGLAPEERVRVLFLGTDPLQVASGDMYQTHLIELAGGISVSEQLVGYWNDANLEQILLWNPDVILIPPYGPVQPIDILANADWSSVRAVQNGRVHRLPRVIAPMDTPVPESLLGIAWMAHAFYPDQIHIDLADEIERFYATYYNYELSETELEHLTRR